MNNSMMLVKSNIKKTKAQTAAIFVLIMITALLINLCLMVSLDYQDGYDDIHKELNEADVTLMVAGLDSEMKVFEKEYLDENEDVSSYQITPVTMLEGAVPYGEDTNYKTFFYGISKTKADTMDIGKYRYEQESDGSGVFLPYQFNVSGIYHVGDHFVLENNGENVIDTTVIGFYAGAMTSNMKARICGFILTDDLYKDLNKTEETPFGKMDYVMTSIQLSDGVDCSQFEYDATSVLAEKYANLKLLESNNTDLVKVTEYATQVISVAVLAVAGLIFAIVSIVLISSNIAFFINTNMKNFGMLKAIGYRSRKLRATILVEFAFVGLLAALCGIGVSYAVFPTLNELTESMTGIPYPVHFMVKPFLIAVAIIMILVLITAWLATRNIKRLPPISAIRNVNMGKKKQRDVASVEKSKLPILWNLALKTTLLNWKQNIIVFIAMLGISLGSVFCILMYQNVVQKQTPIIELTNQNAHSFVNIDSWEDKELKELFDGDERVENYYMYARRSKVVAKDVVLLSIVVDDCSKIDNRVMVHSGVMPENENEVAVGVLYADRNDVHLGDELSISLGDKKEEFKVTAFLQMVGNNGNDIIFLADGYKKLAPLDRYDYLVTLGSDKDIESFNSDVVKDFSDAYVEDYQKYVEGTTADFMQLMRFIIVGIIVICVSLIAFVLYVLVKTMLFKKQKEYSIMKSVGYPTGTLIAQTVLSFLPVVILSLAISLPLASLTINDIFSIFIHNLGVFRTAFQFSALWVVLVGVFIVVLSLSFVCLFSLKIRHYSPKQLLSDNG